MNESRVLHVRGEIFEWSLRDGANQFAWLSGPNKGYGFAIGRTDSAPLAEVEARDHVEAFLTEIDPETGYLRD
ncbi:hypothetical protein QSU92_06335 [Microbacterium sp. ET2]|uniref:hypothetical protein n=1 Tax=Microbacterium albipurpureum TaxID=3050384 RepID=UPI00259D2C10|nr:hypothetical protein [Microbacterium sp. ET2 (Ac-2212)]WJL96785.1 hypothetical protein QSU92_06335 [Microbacterium sp. ET2 (Ac-2212)]